MNPFSSLLQTPPFFVLAWPADRALVAAAIVGHEQFVKGLFTSDHEFAMIGVLHGLRELKYPVPLLLRAYAALRWRFIAARLERPGQNDYCISRWFLSGQDHWLRELYTAAGGPPPSSAAVAVARGLCGPAPVQSIDLRRMSAHWAIESLNNNCAEFAAAWRRLFPEWGRA